MKNILKISITALASAALLCGCIKEVEPTDRATEKQVSLKSMYYGITAALVKANSLGYAADGNAWDFALPAIHIATESMTGDLVVSGITGYDWFGQWGENNALGPRYAAVALPWNNYYTWIKGANDLIGMVPDETAINETEKGYLGATYAFRAMFYLDLVRLYEFKENNYTSAPNLIDLGVPIVLDGTTEAEARNNPRAKVSDVYDTVIFPDLEKAEELLADFTAADKYAVSLAVVYGLKARAYLERATATGNADAYAKAAEFARKAITASGCTPLTLAQWEDPTTGFNDATSNNAWMWALALPSESVYNLFNFTAHMSNEEAWSAYGYQVGRAINKSLYNSITEGDFRKYSWLDPDRSYYNYKSCRPDGAAFFASTLKDYACIKFRPAQGNYADYKTGGAADHVLMRVEEMYFIEAEATAHSNLSEAVRLLNAFMAYRVTDGSYDCSSKASTLDAFVSELMLQKRVEFWGEGILMFDMKRLNISTRRGYVGTNAPPSYRLNCEGRAPYWNFVIIRSETMNNGAITDYNNPDPSGVITPWI